MVTVQWVHQEVDSEGPVRFAEFLPGITQVGKRRMHLDLRGKCIITRMPCFRLPWSQCKLEKNTCSGQNWPCVRAQGLGSRIRKRCLQEEGSHTRVSGWAENCGLDCSPLPPSRWGALTCTGYDLHHCVWGLVSVQPQHRVCSVAGEHHTRTHVCR